MSKNITAECAAATRLCGTFLILKKSRFPGCTPGKRLLTFLYIFVLSSSGLCSAGIRTRDSAGQLSAFLCHFLLVPEAQIRSVNTDDLLQGPGRIIQPAGAYILGFARNAGPSQESLEPLLHFRDPGVVGMTVQMDTTLAGPFKEGMEIMAEHQVLFFPEGPDRDLPVI